MKQLFLIAINNLLQHRKRTLLLGGAICGVTTLLVFLVSMSSGARSAMFETATTIQTGHINVAGFYKVTAGQSAPLVTDYAKVMEVVKKSLTNLDYIVPRGRGWARIVSETGSIQAGIVGIDINAEAQFRKTIRLKYGKMADLTQPNTALVFAEQAKKLNAKIGDTAVISALTPNGTNNTVDVRIVAIAEDVGIFSNFSIFVPYQSVNQLYQLNSDSTGALQVYLKDLKKLPQSMDELRKGLTKAGYTLMESDPRAFWMKFDSVNREDWTGQKIDLTTWEEEISFIQWTIAAIDGLTFILITVLLIIIAIGIMNSMWIAIRERTREIGTLRAIGMHRRRVLFMFLIEAFSLGTASTVAGMFLGLIFAGLLDLANINLPSGAQMFLMSNTLPFAFDIGRIFNGMFVIIMATTLIAIFPAWHAARLKPITAMQQK